MKDVGAVSQISSAQFATEVDQIGQRAAQLVAAVQQFPDAKLSPGQNTPFTAEQAQQVLGQFDALISAELTDTPTTAQLESVTAVGKSLGQANKTLRDAREAHLKASLPEGTVWVEKEGKNVMEFADIVAQRAKDENAPVAGLWSDYLVEAQPGQSGQEVFEAWEQRAEHQVHPESVLSGAGYKLTQRADVEGEKLAEVSNAKTTARPWSDVWADLSAKADGSDVYTTGIQTLVNPDEINELATRLVQEQGASGWLGLQGIVMRKMVAPGTAKSWEAAVENSKQYRH